MGGVGSAIMGKPGSQKSSSGNAAFGPIMSSFSPAFGYTTMGGNAIASLLGLGGGSGGGGTGGTAGYTVDMTKDGVPGNAKAARKAGLPTSYEVAGTPGTGGGGTDDATVGLDNWAKSGGMDWLMEQGNRMINSNQAAKGLLSSGSTLKGIEKYGQGLGSTYLQQYMDNLFKFSNLGLGAGGLAAGAGQWSKGTQTGAKQGLGPMIAQGVGAAIGASDRRLKENIVPLDDGQYEFDYRQDTPLDLPEGRFVGYMADEVPEEFVVNIGHGFKGVKAPFLPERIN